MAELKVTTSADNRALHYRVRYRNALGHWDSLIDGATGKELDLTLTQDFLAEQSNPQATVENINLHMQKLTRKVSVMEDRAW